MAELKRVLLQSLTEIDSVGIEHRQPYKLLGNLWPSRDEESEKIPALKDGPHPNLLI